MDIFCQRVSSFFFFFPAMTQPCAPPEAKWFESTTSVSKVFLYLVGAVKGLSERLYQREDSSTNNPLSKLLFFKSPLNVHSKMPGIQSLDIQPRLTFVAVQRARGDRHNNRDLPQPRDAQSLGGAVPGGAFGLTERFAFCTSDKLRSRS